MTLQRSGDLMIRSNEEHRLNINIGALGVDLGDVMKSKSMYRGKLGGEFKPRTIEFSWSGEHLYCTRIRGPRITARGTESQHDVNELYFNYEDLPQWAKKLLKIAQMQDQYLRYMRRYH